MAADVRFPIRLRTDPGVLSESPEDLLDAISASVTRALQHSSRTVPQGARDVLAPEVRTEVHWSGAGAAMIDHGRRAELEQELRGRIASLVDGQMQATALTRLGDRGEPREPVDAARLDPLLGIYTLPSYQGGSDVAVPASTTITFAPEVVVPQTLEWEPIHSLDELVHAFLATFADHYPQPPTSGRTGAIYRDARRGMSIAVWRLPDGALLGTAAIQGVTSPAVGPDHRSIVNRPLELRPASSYRLHFIAAATAENRTTVIAQVYSQPLTELFRHFGHRPQTMSEDDFQQQLQSRVHDAVEALARSVPDHVVCFVGLDIDGQPGLLYSQIGMPTDLDVELLPVTRSVPVTRHRPRSAHAAPGSGSAARGAGGEGAAGDGADTGAGTSGPGGERGGAVDLGASHADGSMFPSTEPPPDAPAAPGAGSSESGSATCEPFRGEPSLNALGAAGHLMQQMMDEIAARLQIETCEYVGHFLISAASTVGVLGRQVGVAEISESGTAAVAPAEGSLGSLDFHPAASIQTQLLRHLAGVVPLISTLSETLQEAISQHRDLITDDYEHAPGAWTLHFMEELHPIVDESVGELFKMACRVVFLQLLNHSRKAIDDRRLEPGFTRFANLFEHVVLPQLADVNELLRLRDRLQEEQANVIATAARQRWANAYAGISPTAASPAAASPAATAGPRPQSWPDARAGVLRAMALHRHLTDGAASPDADRVIERDGVLQIHDRHGDLWTLDAIERAILLRRGTIESVEPLVKQLTELPEVMERIRAADGDVRGELARILNEMSDDNQDITERATDDPDYAFTLGRIVEDAAAATVPGTLVPLQGIHLLAHQQLGEFFRGTWFYARGLDRLFSSELGKRSLSAFGEFVGIVALAVVCAPLAVAAGIGLAAYHYAEAEEHERVYRALIDPEQVITWSEVEAELFAAEIGVALSFVPVAGELLGEARAAFRVIATEAVDVSEAAARAAAERAAEAMISTAERGFVEKFVVEAVKAYVMQTLFAQVLEPIMQSLEREWGTTKPIGGLDRAMAELTRRAQERNRTLTSGRSPR